VVGDPPMQFSKGGTPMRNLAALEKEFESLQRAGDFAKVVRFMMLGGGSGPAESRANAAHVADELGAPPRVMSVLKAAVAAGSTTSYSQLADFKLAIAGFANSLAHVGVFDSMLAGGMIRVPLSTTVGAISVGASAYSIGEASAKQVSRLSLTNGQLEVLKSHCLLVLTNDLLRFAGPEAERLIARELTMATAQATDSQFISILSAGVTPGTSSGTQAGAFRDDLAIMLNAIVTGNGSRLFLIVTPAISKFLSVLGTTSTSGAPAFESMGVGGGRIADIEVIPSSAMADGTMLLADASGIAAGSGNVELDLFREASLQFDSAPDSPTSAATALVNLWAMNMVGIRCERFFGAEKLRASCVAMTQNVNLGAGFSPA
jgi:HK97 family phage major capsid protein